MNQEQLDHFRSRLRDERERVVRALARFGERAVEADRHADERSDGPLSTAHQTDSYNQAVDALEIARLSRELADIEDALKKLHDAPGRFGVDERTGQPLPFELLDRAPWARTVRSIHLGADPLAADPDVLQAFRNDRYSG